MTSNPVFRFNLDTPPDTALAPLSRFSGWYLVQPQQPVDLVLHLNGSPRAALRYGSPRQDVSEVFPTWPESGGSGFYGDLLLPPETASSSRLNLEIWDHGPGSPRRLFKKTYKAQTPLQPPTWRQRDFSLEALLQCSQCEQDLRLRGETWHCTGCEADGPARGQAFFFLDDQTSPFQMLTEKTNTHPYAEGSYRLLDEVGDGLILDFGSGNSPLSALRSRTCYLDIKQYAHTDVISHKDLLPFKDNSFDGIISQSVFEHLPDPFLTARELYRVLKPGGLIYVDTAFMQPLHADPSHFFNMTKYGLAKVFEIFEKSRIAIAPHHLPSFGLMMQLDASLPFMKDGVWKNRLKALREVLGAENQALDQDLGPHGREILATGWFFEGRKPLTGET